MTDTTAALDAPRIAALMSDGYSQAQAVAALADWTPRRLRHRPDDRQQFLCDVFTTALEGGIGYWSVATRYRWSDTDRFCAVLLPTDETTDEDGVPCWGVWDDARDLEPIRVDADTIQRGLVKYRELAKGRWQSHSGVANVVAADTTNGKQGDYDAPDADVIVQLAVFGEVIYG